MTRRCSACGLPLFTPEGRQAMRKDHPEVCPETGPGETAEWEGDFRFAVEACEVRTDRNGTVRNVVFRSRIRAEMQRDKRLSTCEVDGKTIPVVAARLTTDPRL